MYATDNCKYSITFDNIITKARSKNKHMTHSKCKCLTSDVFLRHTGPEMTMMFEMASSYCARCAK